VSGYINVQSRWVPGLGPPPPTHTQSSMYRRENHALRLSPLGSSSIRCYPTRADHQHQERSTHTTFAYGAQITYPLCMCGRLMRMSWKINKLPIILCATGILESWHMWWWSLMLATQDRGTPCIYISCLSPSESHSC
jgi:hypothetical protein